VTSIVSLVLDAVNTYENTATEGIIIYSTATGAEFNISSSTFEGTLVYEYATAYALMAAQTYSITTPFYFSSSSGTYITCSDNTYKNFLNNQKGGVFNILYASFSDDSSTYSNNSAILGGAIACTGCNVTLVGNTF
jgi:predicted outer membrane repeat protein